MTSDTDAQAAVTPDLSIIVPVYDEETGIRPFLQEMKAVLDKVPETVEYLFVDDGSRDATALEILACQKDDPRIVLVALSRNFGKDAALAAGLAHAKGRAAIPIDVDLQDDPAVIPQMVAKWRAGAQIVNARRIDRRQDSLSKRTTANLYYRVFNLVAERPIPANVGDFRLIDRQVLDVINTFTEKSRFNKDLLSWVGFKTEEVTFERRTRTEGQTKWSFWKLWNFGLDGLFGASTIPLRAWSYVGFLLALFAFLYAAFILVRALIFGVETPGYASTVIIILFFGGLNMLSIGILGEYVGRIYREVRDRPLYIVRETHRKSDKDN